MAIVGPTGAGKTTLVNLLMRFYELDKGHISVDGIPLDSITRENIHDIFGMVLQDTWLFEGSIRDNLNFGKKDISDEELMEICGQCGLKHFVDTLPEGLDTVLGDNLSVSAGQKQLLTIARAMAENAPMLILDEATSSVDTRTEAKIQKAMDALTAGRTSFVIAHRLSTIRDADMILYMEGGDVKEAGDHETLMNIRNTTLVGYCIVCLSSLLGMLFPTSVGVAYAAGFLKQVGYIPGAYMLGALTVSCFDSVEHSSGYRLEGLLAVGIVSTLQNVLYAPVAGLYEKILTLVGFDANSTGFQPAAALTVLGIAFYGIEFVCAGVNVCVLPFIDLEKKLPKINADLLERRRQAVLARGEVWVDPEELERREREEAEKEAEENRVRDLREKCEKKGLDFDMENLEYLAKRAEKERRKARKEQKKEEKSGGKRERKRSKWRRVKWKEELR